MEALTKRSIGKFLVKDLLWALREWNTIGTTDEELHRFLALKTKLEYVKEVYTRLEREYEEDYAFTLLYKLDLISVYRYPQRRLWTAYLFSRKSKKVRQEVDAEAQDTLEHQLHRNINVYSKSDVCILQQNGLFWMSFVVENPRKPEPDVVYLVYYPNTPLIFMTTVKEALKSPLSQCLRQTLFYNELTTLTLSGHCVQSLAQLVVRKHFPDAHAQFLGTQDAEECEDRQHRKQSMEEDRNNGIMYAHYEEEVERYNQIEQVFGKHKLPKLNKLEYKLVTPLQVDWADDDDDDDDDERPFKMRVTFQGESVLEGIRNLTEVGFADTRMASIVKNVHKEGKNVLNVNLRKRENTDVH